MFNDYENLLKSVNLKKNNDKIKNENENKNNNIDLKFSHDKFTVIKEL